jgi:mono/diheme cytochrome c family protein
MSRLFLGAALAMLAGGQGALAQSPAQRGDYLVNSILNCGGCHTPRGPGGADKAFAGGNVFDTPRFKVYSSNITPDRQTGIGNWSNDEIRNALLHGKRPNGVVLAAMPTAFLADLTTTDLDAIIAYLRTLKPVKNEVPAPEYKGQIVHDPLPKPGKMRGKVKRGYYLATIGHCMECHTPMEKGKQLFDTSLGAGGRQFKGPWGVATARNITASKDKGLGSWTDAEIRRAITQGVRKDGSKLNPPMGFAAYAKMTDKDMAALIAYLRTVPPKD